MRPLIEYFYLLVILAMVTIMPRVTCWNDASRMATVQSLVEKQSFIIDSSVFVNTGDKVFIKGHFYSDKLTLPSMLGAVIYLPLHYTGLKLSYGWNLAYYLIILLTVKLFWLFGLVAFYFSLEYCNLDDKGRLWLTAALGFASLYFTWSSTFNNHSLAASQLIIGFYFLLKAKFSGSPGKNLFFSGFFLSLAGATDVPIGLFYVLFSFYIIFNPDLRKKIGFYLIPVFFTVFPTFIVNYYISGSFVPVKMVKAYFQYPFSPWVGSNNLSGMKINQGMFFLSYSFHTLIGKNGFLLYNPLLFLALPYLVRETGKNHKFRFEALIISIASIIIVLYYLLFTNNYGGSSYSIRWFVPLLPLLFFFIHPFFENFTLIKKRIFLTLFSISSIISCIGLITPWSSSFLSKIPLLSNLKLFRIILQKIAY